MSHIHPRTSSGINQLSLQPHHWTFRLCTSNKCRLLSLQTGQDRSPQDIDWRSVACSKPSNSLLCIQNSYLMPPNISRIRHCMGCIWNLCNPQKIHPDKPKHRSCLQCPKRSTFLTWDHMKCIRYWMRGKLCSLHYIFSIEFERCFSRSHLDRWKGRLMSQIEG